MSDGFVPEADRLDQEREAAPAAGQEADRPVPGSPPGPLSPEGVSIGAETPEADALEQAQEVPDFDDYR